MKTKIVLTQLIILTTLLLSLSCNSQTPEQKKQIEAAEKQAAEAQKMVEEMMKNNPQMKQVMDQLKERQAEEKAQREKENTQKEKERAINRKKNREEFYWRGKVASDTNGKFNNWQHGPVKIAIYDGNGKLDANMQYIDKKYVIVGSIGSSGQVTMDLPENIRTPYPISKSLIPELHSVYNRDVVFSKPNTAYRNPGFTLSIVKDGISLGKLYIGNSEKVTYNLAAPCCIDYGDLGYRLYWVYVEEACTAKIKQDFTDKKITIGETEKNLDQTIIYDLHFEPGWNMIKTEVLDNIEINGQSRFKLKKHTVARTMPPDAKYYFLIRDRHNK